MEENITDWNSLVGKRTTPAGAITEVHLTTEIFLPELPGGLRQFHRYAPGLKVRGVQLVIHVKRREHDREPQFVDNDVRVVTHALPESISHHRERELLLRAAVAEIRSRRSEGLRFCLQPNGTSWGSTAFLWRQRLRGIPSVFYSTMFPDDAPPGMYAGTKYRLRLRALLSPLSRLLVCSHRIAAAYRSLARLRPRKTAVLPNGVNLDQFSPAQNDDQKRAVRRALDLPLAPKIVLYSGSITPRKGVDLLVAAWNRLTLEGNLDGAVLVIAGSFGMRPSFRHDSMRRELETFSKAFESALAKFPQPGSIILAGDVDNIADYYRAADIFAFPSKREGLPNSVLEAMASALPCIISEFAGIPDPGEEFGNPGEHHLRVNHEPEAIAAALATLLRDTESAQAMGHQARALMEATQTIDVTLDQLAAEYRSNAK